MKPRLKTLAVFALAATLVTSAAVAEEGKVKEEKAEPKGPCIEDIQKYCKDVKPGEGRLLKCLKEHEKDVALACKEKVADAKEMLRGISEACTDDIYKLCGDVKPGEGRIRKCVREHRDELSTACREKLDAARAKRKTK